MVDPKLQELAKFMEELDPEPIRKRIDELEDELKPLKRLLRMAVSKSEAQRRKQERETRNADPTPDPQTPNPAPP